MSETKKCRYCDNPAVKTLVWLRDKRGRPARIQLPWCGCDLMVALRRIWGFPHPVHEGADYEVEELPIINITLDEAALRADIHGVVQRSVDAATAPESPGWPAGSGPEADGGIKTVNSLAGVRRILGDSRAAMYAALQVLSTSPLEAGVFDSIRTALRNSIGAIDRLGDFGCEVCERLQRRVAEVEALLDESNLQQQLLRSGEEVLRSQLDHIASLHADRRDECDQLRQQLTAGPDKVLRCAYCGHEYPDGTPAAKHQLLAEHIRGCTAHPLSAELRKLADIQKLLSNPKYDEIPRGCLPTAIQQVLDGSKGVQA